DMRSTVEAGLTWIERRFHPAAGDFWLLVPADHPTVDKETVETLAKVASEQVSSTIIVPTFEGRRGHPALIPWRHVPEMRRLKAGLGINAFLREHNHELLEVPVESSEILWDLDTPEDYERLKRREGS